ncbi:MAG: membrane protein insertase YidC [Sphingopyxis sp.]|nr:membrane protein insertase YidC [Sphingopyxis sp.]
MEDKRNIILAMVLAMLILFGWPYLAQLVFPTPPQTATTQQAATTGSAATAPGTPGSAPPAQRAQAVRSVTAALADGPRIAIETPKLRGSINLAGARIDDLVLLNYRQTIDNDSPPVRLFAPAGTRDYYFAGSGWTGPGLNAPTTETVWTAPAGAKLTPTTPVTLSHDNGQGQVFELTFAVDADYMFTVTQRVTNRGAAPVGVQPYAFLSRKGVSPDLDTWTIHSGAMGVFNGEADYINLDRIRDVPNQTLSINTTGGWLGYTDHFWLGAVVPDQTKPVTARFTRQEGARHQADFAEAEALLAPNATRTSTVRVFGGAKEIDVLDRYMDSGITLFDRATDWGWFIWFAKPIFNLLDWLFRFIGNFGFAIMALTLIIRLLMFPIAQRQFASMAQMRIVQPKLKAIQDKHKDDKPRMQQEMMELYKKEKINPLAGCLPILIQIPIFYALYKVLMLTVEMRHQPFALWIKDLSVPDPAMFLNLFGLLPFTPPAFLGIGVLAVLLGITMWAQFKLNPPPTDPVQQQVFAIMPWVLMFVMASFAAGLLLYWITNNILSIGQQRLLYARYPEMKTAMAVK